MAPRSTIRPDGTKSCTKCETIKQLSEFYTSGKRKNGTPKYNSWCKKCNGIKMASYHKRTWGPERLHFTAHKRTKSVRAYMTYLLAKARKRNDCKITVDNLEIIWNSQNGKCALTGWNMSMRLGKGSVFTNASIDRIDSRIGYIEGNVQLVCRAANVAKSDLPMSDFVALCSAVTEIHREQTQDARLAA